jgi:gliding motility-associated-like protein
VIINKLISVNAGDAQIICANNATVFLNGNLTGSSTASGVWTTSGSGTFYPSNTSLDARYIASSADTAFGSVRLTLSSNNNGSCPQASSSLVVTITDAPKANAGTDKKVCAEKAEVKLAGVMHNTYSGKWISSGTGQFIPSDTDLNATYSPSNADKAKGLVRLVLTTTDNGLCLPALDTVLLVISPTPVANAGPDRMIYEGENATLSPVIGGARFKWTPNLYFVSADTAFYPVVTGVNDITYYLTVTSSDGCVSQPDPVNISVLKPITIPNVFSPNGDGTNDLWNIKNLSKYTDATVSIFNRYGQKVFSCIGYDTPWDGNLNGKQLPLGVYYYLVDTKRGKLRSGYVTILR